MIHEMCFERLIDDTETRERKTNIYLSKLTVVCIDLDVKPSAVVLARFFFFIKNSIAVVKTKTKLGADSKIKEKKVCISFNEVRIFFIISTWEVRLKKVLRSRIHLIIERRNWDFWPVFFLCPPLFIALTQAHSNRIKKFPCFISRNTKSFLFLYLSSKLSPITKNGGQKRSITKK